jgi:hypothetical protein
MPRNVRNFWIDLSVDGKKTTVQTGPKNKDGGFRMDILIRSDGNIETAAGIEGYAYPDGRLELAIRPMGHPEVLVVTKR